jgi:hypothetical protein
VLLLQDAGKDGHAAAAAAAAGTASGGKHGPGRQPRQRQPVGEQRQAFRLVFVLPTGALRALQGVALVRIVSHS